MTGVEIALWLLPAALLFWSVGAYNRLVRLRAQVKTAFALLAVQLAGYAIMVEDCVKSSPDQVSPELLAQAADNALAALAALHGACTQFQASLRVASARPLGAAGMAALETAHGTLQVAWERLLEQAIARPELAPAASRIQWAEQTRSATHAMAAFNQAVLSYNAAIAQFPALLLARAVGFRPAGCLCAA